MSSPLAILARYLVLVTDSARMVRKEVADLVQKRSHSSDRPKALPPRRSD